MKIFVILTFFFKLCQCICPLCPIIAGVAASGGANTENSILSWIAGLTSVPFMLAFFDGFRTRNMTFSTPQKDSIVRVNESLDFYMETFGLSSRSYFRTSDLYLLNASFDRAAKVASEKEFKVIIQSHYSPLYVLPRSGLGHMKWVVPDVPNGRYYLKYVSGWTIWRHEGKFSAISNPFYILNSDCDNSCLESIPPLQDASSFESDNAPLELQFMFPKYRGAKNASIDFLKGITSTPRLLMNPKNAVNEWENEFEKNPFKATGQAVGAVGALAIAFKTISQFVRKSPCYGASCERQIVRKTQVKITVFSIILFIFREHTAEHAHL